MAGPTSGYPAGRIGDRGDREFVYVPNVYVPFLAPRKEVHIALPRMGHLLLQGSLGPFEPKVEKKWVPWASRPQSPKSSTRSRKKS